MPHGIIEPLHDSSSRDTSTSKSEGRLIDGAGKLKKKKRRRLQEVIQAIKV